MFNRYSALIQILKPTLLQVLAAVAPIGAYFVMDQGADVLSRLGEDVYPDGTYWATSWFIIANLCAGTTIWWTSRVALTLRFSGQNPAHSLPNWFVHRLYKWWPRILGVFPVAVISCAFFWRLHDYNQYKAAGTDLQLGGLVALGLIHAGLVIVLLIAFDLRRRWLDRRHAPPSHVHYESFSEMRSKSPSTYWVHLSLLGVAIIFILVLWMDNLPVSRFLLSPAIFSFAAAIWVLAGTWLLQIQSSTGCPLLLLLALAFFSFSYINDNHQIRICADRELKLSDAKTVTESFSEWLAAQPKLPLRQNGTARQRPVFVVATEGGGIRAAYWTAEVLASLKEPYGSNPTGLPAGVNFANSTFAISGISGGSIGAAVFDALLYDKQDDLVNKSQAILGQDHLSPLIAGLLFPEFIQQFLPVVPPGTDRAALFEHSLEDAYGHVAKTKTFSNPFRDLWASGLPLPHLFLNSTLVETGQRLIFSDLAINSENDNPEFLNAVDARKEIFVTIKGENNKAEAIYHDIPLSTAGHASARFTYTNPQGTLSLGRHFVDGGYFEDSGITTALEIIKVMNDVLRSNEQSRKPSDDGFYPVLIVISNSFPNERNSPQNRPLMNILAPPEALLNARTARGEWARAVAAVHEYLTAAAPVISKSSREQPYIVENFSLTKEGIPLPLGWSLSNHAKGEMEHQLWKADSVNAKSRKEILQMLTNSSN